MCKRAVIRAQLIAGRFEIKGWNNRFYQWRGRGEVGGVLWKMQNYSTSERDWTSLHESIDVCAACKGGRHSLYEHSAVMNVAFHGYDSCNAIRCEKCAQATQAVPLQRLTFEFRLGRVCVRAHLQDIRPSGPGFHLVLWLPRVCIHWRITFNLLAFEWPRAGLLEVELSRPKPTKSLGKPRRILSKAAICCVNWLTIARELLSEGGISLSLSVSMIFLIINLHRHIVYLWYY